MKIQKLIKDLAVTKRRISGGDFEVKGISCNSKSVKDGFIFVAVKGAAQDGNKFIAEALRHGAKAVISDSAMPAGFSKRVSFIKVKDARKALAKLAGDFYAQPSKKMKVVGITGTNGKTTITYLIEAIVHKKGGSPAVIGTINYRFKNKVIPSHNTTPGPLELQSLLRDMRDEGINYAVMEASSHALDQERVLGINFHSAIFTNLTQDHLDYHKTLKKYFQAKAKLFTRLSGSAFAVINNDDAYGRKLKKFTRAKVITYGIDNRSMVMARNITATVSGTEFDLVVPGRVVKMHLNLIGRHNIYNVLAAVAWAVKDGISISVIKSAIEKFHLVPGRLERIDSKDGFSVFVDYAHTEDALSNILAALRPLAHRKIIVVFGCGGDRDKTKRPKMGHVATERADLAIITNDNPRSEHPRMIIADIERGIKRNNLVIPERRKAIQKSLSIARSGDVVLVAGKGHENYQIQKNKTIHFDDREVVRECLKSMS
jgi:UDP-N-acetylmuramoyl-L-alanyl-D-glutamate--2,6-diaminopimelate ligase